MKPLTERMIETEKHITYLEKECAKCKKFSIKQIGSFKCSGDQCVTTYPYLKSAKLDRQAQIEEQREISINAKRTQFKNN